MDSFILPNWPAPSNIKAYTTTRLSELEKLHLPSDPIWIQQVHGIEVIEANKHNIGKQADASFSNNKNTVCVVRTADCIPILLCNKQSTTVAAIHAGWRGLANGIIEATIQKLNLAPEDILIWLGPCISVKHFEVGNEVKTIFEKNHPEASQYFTPSVKENHWFANLYGLATMRLNKMGIHQVFGGEYCTYADKDLFYSYRRDGQQTGRMASLIWIE